MVPGKAITGMVRPENAEGLRRIMLIERHGRGVSLQAEGAMATVPLAWGLSASISAAAGYAALPSRAVPSPRRSATTRTTCAWWAITLRYDDCVEAVGQGGHVLVRNGEVVARIPLALGGLMSEGAAEDVAAQHDDFMVKARAMGIEPPLDPIMGIIFLPLPVIPTLRIRPEACSTSQPSPTPTSHQGRS